jgi:sugar phosphate isomerase/epimerase
MNTKAPPIAIQLYTVRDALSADWRSTLLKIAEAGYLGVETAGFSYAPPKEVKALFDELGLQVVGAHAGLPSPENQDELLRTLDIMECRRLICAGSGSEHFGTLADVQERTRTFNAANAFARSHNLTFGLHNHWWEFTPIEGRLAYDVLRDELDEDIFFELDIYWAQSAGVDPVDYLNQLGAKVPLVHVKDGSTDQADAMVAVGQGKMDIPAALHAAKHAEWLIVELDRCDTDMMTAVIESYRYLTEAGMASGRERQ